MSRTETPAPDAEAGPRRFGYGFARDAGLVLLGAPGEEAVIGARAGEGGGPDADPWALAEAYRASGGARVEVLERGVFERRLSEVYSSEGLSAATFEDEGTEDLSSLAEGLPATADLLDTEDDAPVIRLINALIAEAVKTRASDIHVEPYEDRLSVRLRIDGVLREVLSLPARMIPVLTSRIKVMSRLDIAEKRLPQDGRISLSMGGKMVDVRVSTLPSAFGERVVMRLLDKEQANLDLGALGMPEDLLARWRALLARENGILLVTGPTGSGKTTTLYASLLEKKTPEINVLTVEDPVEYTLEGISQVPVNPKAGMTFAMGLRAFLRQDPNVIMVGEIRDFETAEIATTLSLTGHLILSTVHTNSALGAFTRMRDIGIDSYTISSTIAGVMSQRLVRRLCEACKAPHPASEAELGLMDMDGPLTIYAPKGCPVCSGTGYEGRIGLYELVVVDAPLRRLIARDATEDDMASHVFRDVTSLAQAGWGHVAAGHTSIEEVFRVVRGAEA